MKKIKLNTINGRLTFIIFFLILNFSIFGGYVLYQSYIIKKDFFLLNRQGEPAVTLTFISVSLLEKISISVLNSHLEYDTLNKKGDINRDFDSFFSTYNILKTHTDTLGVKQYENVYSTVVSQVEELRRISLGLIDIIGKYKKGKEEKDSLFLKEYKSKFNQKFWEIHGNIFSNLTLYSTDKENRSVELTLRTERIVIVTLVILLISLFISIYSWLSLSKYFKSSIDKIIIKLHEIAKGKLVEEKIAGSDEIAQIFEANNILIKNLSKASEFAKNIGKGNYEYKFSPVSEEDILGKSLVTMRDELFNFKKEDEKRIWISEGYTVFGELLRSKNDNIAQLSESFVAELIKYLNLNQGSIFITEEINGKTNLVLKGCYAYSKKKYIEMNISPGEGLVGQVYLEAEYRYFTQVPDDYIKITSGLGEALPRFVVIVPVKIYNEVLGVIELASFNEIEKYKIDFILKICSDLASVIKAVVNNERTKDLLKQVQEKSEQMYSQEEELRQNMEELLSTQEEMVRKEKSYLNTIEQLSQNNNLIK